MRTKGIRYIIGFISHYISNCKSIYRQIRNTNLIDSDGVVRVSGETKLMCAQNIHIGDGTYVNGGRLYASKNAKIVIGRNCLLSYNIHLRTKSHNYSDPNVPIINQGEFEKDIIIGDDVWIGYGAQIMPGVSIEKGCVIGAGAIVTKNTIPYGVYVGCPAKLIKRRNEHIKNNVN